jgi:hypothetical protein
MRCGYIIDIKEEHIMRKTIRIAGIVICLSACCILFASWFTGCGSYGATTLPDDIQVAEIMRESNNMTGLNVTNEKYIQDKDYDSIIISDKDYTGSLLDKNALSVS